MCFAVHFFIMNFTRIILQQILIENLMQLLLRKESRMEQTIESFCFRILDKNDRCE